MADLSVKWAGLMLKNPFICASGPLTDTVDRCKAAADAGFAAVTLKSIMHRKAGDKRWMHAVPRFKVVDRLNQLERWTPDKGFDRMECIPWGESGSVWTEEKYGWFINEVKRTVGNDVKVGASVWGSARRPEDWDEYLDIFNSSNCDYVELDMGYSRFYRWPENIISVVKNAKRKLSVPVHVKMYPFLTFPSDTARMLQDSGADGVIMFDGAMGLDFDIDTLKFPFYDGTLCKAVNGTALPYVFRSIAETRKDGVKIAISGSYRILNWEDAVKCIMCGADTVQVHTRIMLRGYREVSHWLSRLEKWMDQKSYSSLPLIKGKILEKLIRPLTEEDVPREIPLELGGTPSKRCIVKRDKCMGCVKLCVPACFHFALRAVNGAVVVDDTRCSGCGLCVGICPHDALSLQPTK
jgi:dihydroorotate dehydrogenase (fumarate)